MTVTGADKICLVMRSKVPCRLADRGATSQDFDWSKGFETMRNPTGWLVYPVAALAALLSLSPCPAAAGELQVFGVAPVRTTATALSAAYAQSSGHTVTPTIVASD